MSKSIQFKINNHRTYIQRIIEESSNINGKNLMTMKVNDLSESVLKDIDDLKTYLKRPLAEEKQSNEESNTLKKEVKDENKVSGDERFSAVKRFSKLKKKEYEIMIDFNSENKDNTNKNSNTNSTTSTETRIESPNRKELYSYSTSKFELQIIQARTQGSFSISKGTYEQEVKMLKDRIRSLRQENEKINKELTRMVALKKEEDTHDCKHKTMFIRKCEEIERIEDKFEEISQKFSLIMENINQSKASYLQDTTRLRELLVCILRCYKENNFEVLEYLFENLNGNFGSNDEIFEINALDKKRNINTPPRQERNKIKLSDKGLNHKGHEVNLHKNNTEPILKQTKETFSIKGEYSNSARSFSEIFTLNEPQINQHIMFNQKGKFDICKELKDLMESKLSNTGSK